MLVCAHCDLFPPGSPPRRALVVSASEIHRQGETLFVSAGIGSGSPSLAAFYDKSIPLRATDFRPDITGRPCRTSHPVDAVASEFTAATATNISDVRLFSYNYFENRHFTLQNKQPALAIHVAKVFSRDSRQLPHITVCRSGLRDDHVRQTGTECREIARLVRRTKPYRAALVPLSFAPYSRARPLRWARLFFRGEVMRCLHRKLTVRTERDRCSWVQCCECNKAGPKKHSYFAAVVAWGLHTLNQHPRGTRKHA